MSKLLNVSAPRTPSSGPENTLGIFSDATRTRRHGIAVSPAVKLRNSTSLVARLPERPRICRSNSMRGVCAPTRLAAAGVRIVHSAPVSSSRVTGAPLATRVTIGALRRVATVISPTRLVPQPTARVSAAAATPPSADASATAPHRIRRDRLAKNITRSMRSNREPGPFVDGQQANPEIVDLDRADRSEADLDSGIKIERHSEREEQCGTDNIAVADDDHRPVSVRLAQLEQGPDGALLDLAHALAARDAGDAAAGAPQSPALVRPDGIKGQAGPLAEIELQYILAVLDRQIEPLGEDLCRLAGALQRARTERGDLFFGEAVGDRSDLGAAPRRQTDTRRAPCEHAISKHVIAVPQQMKDGHRAQIPPSWGRAFVGSRPG